MHFCILDGRQKQWETDFWQKVADNSASTLVGQTLSKSLYLTPLSR